MKRLGRTVVAAGVMVSMATPQVWAAGPAASQSALRVSVAQAKAFSRVEFRWSGRVPYTSRREGQKLFVTFARDAAPEVGELKVLPPRWIEATDVVHKAGKIEFVFTLAKAADAKLGEADGAVYLNIFEQPPEALAASAPEHGGGHAPPDHADPGSHAVPAAAHAVAAAVSDERAPLQSNRPNPVPLTGVVGIERETSDHRSTLSFKWKNPLASAVFRRGDAIWILFDARAGYESGKFANVPQIKGHQSFKGEHWSGVRLDVLPGTLFSTRFEDGRWAVTLSSRPVRPSPQVALDRNGETGTLELQAIVAGAGQTIWVDDPVVGDRIAVVPAMAPSKGNAQRRQLVDMTLLESANGLAVEIHTPGTEVVAEGDLVRFSKPAGLALSPQAEVEERLRASNGFPQPAAMPGLIDPTWAQTGDGGFLKRYDALLRAVSDEYASESGQAAQTQVASDSRLALARFLIGSGLAHEAIGVLNDLARSKEDMLGKSEFRALRGMARTLAGRYKEAEADFSSPVLASDPSTQLWRGYISSELGNWADASRQLQAGELALPANDPLWRARFQRASAESALRDGDVQRANTMIQAALSEKVSSEEELAIRLIQARIIEATGDAPRAERMFEAIGNSPVTRLAAAGKMHATRLKLDRETIKPQDAIAVFDGLRFRWRGDATEVETIRNLGNLYLSQGLYREAMETFRSLGNRMPDLPEAIQVQEDLSNTFRALFLDGMADGMQPIQALGLYFDFKELTPVGSDGDLMVRKLVRRLVDVDLLDPAAELLKYQVDQRLDGVSKAQVATELSTIYLMARKPEAALAAINASRSTLLPAALNTERRINTARALAALGRLDAAEEIIETDTSAEAREVRAEIAWRARNWPVAAALYEASLGDRFRQTQPLTLDEEGRLLRAGIALSLAGDERGLGRLRGRFEPFVAKAKNPDGLRVALQEMGGDGLDSLSTGPLSAENQAFAGWVGKMKQRFRDKASGKAVASAPAAPATAATPKKS